MQSVVHYNWKSMCQQPGVGTSGHLPTPCWLKPGLGLVLTILDSASFVFCGKGKCSWLSTLSGKHVSSTWCGYNLAFAYIWWLVLRFRVRVWVTRHSLTFGLWGCAVGRPLQVASICQQPGLGSTRHLPHLALLLHGVCVGISGMRFFRLCPLLFPLSHVLPLSMFPV